MPDRGSDRERGRESETDNETQRYDFTAQFQWNLVPMEEKRPRAKNSVECDSSLSVREERMLKKCRVSGKRPLAVLKSL